MKTLIKGGTILDGTGAPPRKGDIEIVDGKIGAVGTANAAEKWDRVVDATGKTVMPGLINCHLHFSLNASTHPMNDMSKTDPYTLTIQGVKVAERLLRAGITTVRDMGGLHHEVLSLRNAIRNGVIPGPNVVAPGQALIMTGGHFAGVEVDGVPSCLAAARGQIKAGADFVKIMATGGLGRPDEIPGAQELTEEEIAACAAVGRMAGKTSAAHAHGAEGIRAAVLGGVTSVEHCTLLEDDVMDMMVEKGTVVVPTFAAYWVMAYEGKERGIADYMINASKWVMDEKMPRFQRAVKKGVKIAFGTDGGSPVNPHEGVLTECKCMIEGGMSPMEVVLSITRNAAELLQLGDRTGTLETGKNADVILIDGNPLEDIGRLAEVSMVFKSGFQV